MYSFHVNEALSIKLPERLRWATPLGRLWFQEQAILPGAQPLFPQVHLDNDLFIVEQFPEHPYQVMLILMSLPTFLFLQDMRAGETHASPLPATTIVSCRRIR
tara:strand:+ start:255 stop:563 length:309 start_codon:yes stop_codon:yes gene_type:complete